MLLRHPQGPGATGHEGAWSLPASTAVERAVLGFILWLIIGFVGVENTCGHGIYHDVVEELSARIVKYPSEHRLRYLLAEAHAEHGEWNLALEELKRVEQMAPGQFHPGYIVGRSEAAAGTFSMARISLESFLEKNPDHPSAKAELGRVLLRLGDFSGGARELAAAAEDTAGRC
jgi:thioredoxin-like negative regulator of GroEL